MIPSSIAQGAGGLGFLWLLLPLVCCGLGMGGRGERQQRGQETQSFYVDQGIEETYEQIVEKTNEWRWEAEQEEHEDSITSRIAGFLGGGDQEERFMEGDKELPRLYSLKDKTGPVYFELTDVEDGGTHVEVTYNPMIEDRMRALKASLPIVIREEEAKKQEQ
jgi:hypothetical protein